MGFTVWGTVTIEQQNCRKPVLTHTGAHGHVTTYYALLSWREIYQIYLFSSKEERAEFRDSRDLHISNPTLVFVQDFGNSASDKQCVYFGSFTDPVGGDGAMVGALGRYSGLEWSIGDTFEEDKAPTNGNCPEGYPRQWDATPTSLPNGEESDTSRGNSFFVIFTVLMTSVATAGLLKGTLW